MYPEWIQEQLDKIGKSQPAGREHDGLEPATVVRLAAIESRVIHHISRHFDHVQNSLDRIEVKLNRLIAFCEGLD